MVDPQKTGWEERARIYGFNQSLFPYQSLGKDILSPELLSTQKCGSRRLIVSGEQLGAGFPIPLYNMSNPLFYAIYSKINPPCGVMQLNGNSIRVISEWVARSEGRSYYYEKLPEELKRSPDFWTADNFFKYYKVEKSLLKEKAPWSVSLGKVDDSSHALGDVDLSGSKTNTLLRHSSDEVWFSKHVLIEGPVLYGCEDKEGRVERKKFEDGHNFPAVDFYKIYFSEEEREKSQEKIAHAKLRKAEQEKLKRQKTSDRSDDPKKRKRSSRSAPAGKGEIGQQSDVLTIDDDAAKITLGDPSRKRGKTVAAKKKSVKASSPATEAVTRRLNDPPSVPTEEVDDEETEDERSPTLRRLRRGGDLNCRAAGMPNSQIAVPSQGPSSSFPVGDAFRPGHPDTSLSEYGSNIGSSLTFPTSAAAGAPSIPHAFVQQPFLGPEAQNFAEQDSLRSPHADDLASLLKAHARDPQNYPLGPSVSGFLAQVFSGSLDRSSFASAVAHHQSFVEAQKYHGRYLLDLIFAQGVEVARLGKDNQLLRQENSSLTANVKGLEGRLETAASDRDGYSRDVDIQRGRASNLDEELRLSRDLCKEKDIKISALDENILQLNNHIQGEAERTALFGRSHGRYLFRNLGMRPPYYHDGIKDPDAVLESDKDLVSSEDVELVVAELRVARLAEDFEGANNDLMMGGD